MFERLAGDGRVVLELIGDHLAEELVLWKFLREVLVVGKFVDFAHTVHQDDFLEAFVGNGIADDAHERREAGAGRQHIQALGRDQVIDQQRAGRLAPDDHGVPDLNVLQPGGQRAVLNLDAQELEVLLVVRADDAVGAQQGFAVDTQANHREVTVAEPKRRVSGQRKGKLRVGPMVD